MWISRGSYWEYNSKLEKDIVSRIHVGKSMRLDIILNGSIIHRFTANAGDIIPFVMPKADIALQYRVHSDQKNPFMMVEEYEFDTNIFKSLVLRTPETSELAELAELAGLPIVADNSKQNRLLINQLQTFTSKDKVIVLSINFDVPTMTVSRKGIESATLFINKKEYQKVTFNPDTPNICIFNFLNCPNLSRADSCSLLIEGEGEDIETNIVAHSLNILKNGGLMYCS